MQFAPLGEGEGAKPGPAPVEKPAKLGKKEQAERDAVGAEQGTAWDGVLPSGNVVALR
jgi:hypothetical protein